MPDDLDLFHVLAGNLNFLKNIYTDYLSILKKNYKTC